MITYLLLSLALLFCTLLPLLTQWGADALAPEDHE